MKTLYSGQMKSSRRYIRRVPGIVNNRLVYNNNDRSPIVFRVTVYCLLFSFFVLQCIVYYFRFTRKSYLLYYNNGVYGRRSKS